MATLIIYIIIFIHIHKDIQDEHQAATINRHDINLAVYGFCIFVAMFLNVVYVVLRAIMPKGDMETWKLLIILYGVCNDVFSWCNPWLCLILLKTVRKHMLTTLICKQNAVTPN